MPNSPLLLLTDWQKSTIGGIDRTLQVSRGYDPYGYLAPGSAWMLRFRGQLWDALSSMYLLGNGYRGYSTVLRRFICPDSFSPFGAGGWNAYVYCSADPINSSDPSGHIKTKDMDLFKVLKNGGNFKNIRLQSEKTQSMMLREDLFSRGDETLMLMQIHSSPSYKQQIGSIKTPLALMNARSKYIQNKNTFEALANAGDIPPLIEASNIALGLRPTHEMLGRKFIARALYLNNYGELTNDVHLRVRQKLQTHARKNATKHTDLSWLEQSKRDNELLRSK